MIHVQFENETGDKQTARFLADEKQVGSLVIDRDDRLARVIIHGVQTYMKLPKRDVRARFLVLELERDHQGLGTLSYGLTNKVMLSLMGVDGAKVDFEVLHAFTKARRFEVLVDNALIFSGVPQCRIDGRLHRIDFERHQRLGDVRELHELASYVGLAAAIYFQS